MQLEWVCIKTITLASQSCGTDAQFKLYSTKQELEQHRSGTTGNCSHMSSTVVFGSRPHANSIQNLLEANLQHACKWVAATDTALMCSISAMSVTGTRQAIINDSTSFNALLKNLEKIILVIFFNTSTFMQFSKRCSNYFKPSKSEFQKDCKLGAC